MTSGPVTTLSIRTQKGQGRLVAITAYDYTFARLVDELSDIVLVGDSLGMVVQGKSDTLSVTLEQMIYHTQSVARGLKHAHLVADMPFMTYQVNMDEALRNAGRLLSQGRAQSVKLEGGVTIAPTIERLTQSGIPVMGHIGLTPQSVHQLGGFKRQGKTASQRESLLQDAMSLEDAGAYALVLESVPMELAQDITERIKIPTIGIGAGKHCDGQILVLQDMLGLNTDFTPHFVKAFSQLSELVKSSLHQYAKEVREGTFPAEEHSFHYADT